LRIEGGVPKRMGQTARTNGTNDVWDVAMKKNERDGDFIEFDAE